ncbi:hypothetical protein [Nocardioides sp. AX2bis]|uniref:hypothetical protein n=1 Tax=Nocardioides sp. AX2bis TaxID=2653157 RepID=UPI0012F0928D|nr:hypothetical protein [Nocardioides sp. AX2bis]VXB26324.1 conserved hypothetical protein [Nocardioides sp. AX2bis]
MTDAKDWPTRLNASFYDQDPTAYFRDRMSLLALRATRGPDLTDLMGFRWGSLLVGRDPAQRSPEEEAERTTRFVVAESQVLLHHAAEAAIRTFLAHASNADTPWLAMSALQNHREFRDRVAELAAPAAPDWVREGAGWALLGLAPAAMDTDAEAVLAPSLRVLQALAQRVNGDANLYNSAKHGMTLLPGIESVALETEDGQPLVCADGTRVTYLERSATSRAEWTWSQTTRWVSPQGAFSLTQLAVLLIEAVWRVARWRYVDVPLGQVRLVDASLVDTVLSEFAAADTARLSLRIGTQPRPPRKSNTG